MKNKVSYYYKRKADLRDEAIDYQNNFYKHSYSYGELTMIESRFIELGRRYGLIREFKENGII